MSGTTGATTAPSFTGTLTSFRTASLQLGDTIEGVAARELGDASQWQTIVGINGLTWPYVTDDVTLVGPGVLYSNGGTIIVPGAGSGQPTAVVDTDAIFGTDIALDSQGFLDVGPDGDLAVATGLDNLNQALTNRVLCELGELAYHPDYGSLVPTLLGQQNTGNTPLLAAGYAARSIAADPRVASAAGTSGTVEGDVITITPTVTTVDGKTLPAGNVAPIVLGA